MQYIYFYFLQEAASNASVIEGLSQIGNFLKKTKKAYNHSKRTCFRSANLKTVMC